MVVRGVQGHFLVVGELLGNYLPLARAPGAAGLAGGPHALAPERRLGAEVVEVLGELRRPQLAEGEGGRGMVRESPQRR